MDVPFLKGKLFYLVKPNSNIAFSIVIQNVFEMIELDLPYNENMIETKNENISLIPLRVKLNIERIILFLRYNMSLN